MPSAALSAALFGAALALSPAYGQSAPPVSAVVDADILPDAVTLALAAINRELKRLPPQSGRFSQVLPTGGVAQGSYLMDWPERLRFAYTPHVDGEYEDEFGGERGDAGVVTVRGEFVAVQDTPRAEPNWFPVSLTPLAVLRRAAAQGIQPAMVTAYQDEPDFLALTLHDPKGDLPGMATLYFSKPDFQLYAWRLVDVQNLVTQIRLYRERLYDEMPAHMFHIDYDEPDEE